MGENTDAKMIYDCVNYGGISGENVGGITGWNWNGTVYSCTNLGTINGTANAGGVVGANVGNIFYCEKSICDKNVPDIFFALRHNYI